MSEFNGDLKPTVTYPSVEIRANAESEYYIQLEKATDGSFNLYLSLNSQNLSTLEKHELLVGVA
jgi:hypothetical protein